MAPENGWLEYFLVSFWGPADFRGRTCGLRFREGITCFWFLASSFTDLALKHKDADSEVGGLLKKPEVLPVDQSLSALVATAFELKCTCFWCSKIDLILWIQKLNTSIKKGEDLLLSNMGLCLFLDSLSTNQVTEK